jgi:hypothetical protein
LCLSSKPYFSSLPEFCNFLRGSDMSKKIISKGKMLDRYLSFSGTWSRCGNGQEIQPHQPKYLALIPGWQAPFAARHRNFHHNPRHPAPPNQPDLPDPTELSPHKKHLPNAPKSSRHHPMPDRSGCLRPAFSDPHRPTHQDRQCARACPRHHRSHLTTSARVPL